VKLAIHNLDASISNMEKLVNEMKQNDSIYHRAVALMPDSLSMMCVDSLQMVIGSFGSRRYYITDNSTKEIFSSSFEVWQNLDDTKVIGRIGNCYSILNTCSKEYDKISDLINQVHFEFIKERLPEDYASTEAAVKTFLKRHDVMYALEWYSQMANTLDGLVDLAKQLNERNKEELGIEQEELDEIGKLLDKE
ncbi:hypothetical protein, partial [uncultured Duncaniella sp.]|uniref:hypothetical protein n=1 Tax=uncultured Duncaniella sp. TaxID=2768039 RepID=UPI0027296086